MARGPKPPLRADHTPRMTEGGLDEAPTAADAEEAQPESSSYVELN